MRKRTYSNNSGGRNNNNGGANRGRGGRGKYNNNRGPVQNHDSDHVSPRQRQQATTNRDKYENMARDAKASGDRVQMEYYLQYAEHYNRVLNLADEQREKQEAERREKQEAQQAERAESDSKKDENAPANKAESAKTEGAPKAEAEEAKKPARAPRKKPAPKVEESDKGDDGAQLEALLPTPKPIVEEA